MEDRFPISKFTPEQTCMLADGIAETLAIGKNTKSLRDSEELASLNQTVGKLYSGLDLQPPAIYILDSPMACAFAWSHTPQTTAARWRVFNDEFYTHPLSSPIVDVISDGYNAFTRLVQLNISTSIRPELYNPIHQQYSDFNRVGNLIEQAIVSLERPMQNTSLVESFRKQVNAYISNSAIRDSVSRQPVPPLDSLFLPGVIFRGQQFTDTAYFKAMGDLGVPFHGYHKNLINLWQQISKACNWWFPYKHVLILSDRASALHTDERGRPHNSKGPAIEFRDGWKLYAWKGITIPADIVENPQTITAKRIMDENNTEVRRAMIDIFGIDRFIIESDSASLDKQGEYELLEVPYIGGNMIALKMRCPTTSAVYVHTVHPDCTNVEQALAWKRGEDDFVNARPYREGLLWEK